VQVLCEGVIRRIVEGHGVGLSISGLCSEGQPVRDVIVGSFDMLGTEGLRRADDQIRYVPSDDLDQSIVWGGRVKVRGPEDPPDSRGVVTKGWIVSSRRPRSLQSMMTSQMVIAIARNSNMLLAMETPCRRQSEAPGAVRLDPSR
jgi:hypothetical protein